MRLRRAQKGPIFRACGAQIAIPSILTPPLPESRLVGKEFEKKWFQQKDTKKKQYDFLFVCCKINPLRDSNWRKKEYQKKVETETA